MRRRKKHTDWRETISKYQVHTKDGVEKFLIEVAEAFRRLYPGRFRYYIDALRKLREVQKNADGSFRDQKGREYQVQIRVPTELMLYIQRWHPEFVQDSADIETLIRVWCDLVRVGKDRRRRRTLYIDGKWFNDGNDPDQGRTPARSSKTRRRRARRPTVCDDHREGCPEDLTEDPTKPRIIT